MINSQLKAPGKPVHYPESDGKPLAESDTHLEEVVSIRLTLRQYFADQENVYVSGLNLIYYVEGDPRKCFSPDVYVTRGIPRGRRRVYLVWAEGRVPDIAFEVTSKKTRSRDVREKRALYAQLGIREYVLFDPEAEYLKPPFQLLRLKNGEYEPQTPDAEGAYYSEALNLRLKVIDEHLRFVVPETGELVALPEDEASARAEAEATAHFLKRRAEQESRKRAEAEARAGVESQRAEAESQRADAESQRATALEEGIRFAQQQAEAEAQRAAQLKQEVEVMLQEQERLRELLRQAGFDATRPPTPF